MDHPQHTAPPEGFVIVTDGTVYRFRWPDGTLSLLDNASLEEAINVTWICHERLLDQRREWVDVII